MRIEFRKLIIILKNENWFCWIRSLQIMHGDVSSTSFLYFFKKKKTLKKHLIHFLICTVGFGYNVTLRTREILLCNLRSRPQLTSSRIHPDPHHHHPHHHHHHQHHHVQRHRQDFSSHRIYLSIFIYHIFYFLSLYSHSFYFTHSDYFLIIVWQSHWG